METSVIVRTKNEERYLEKVLKKLKKQTYTDFGIIIVDDNSTDKTLKIAQKYTDKIISIPPGKFTHPYSCNLGAQEASGKFLAYLNGHSIPVYDQYLEKGVENFQDKTVAGVYGTVRAHSDGTWADKLIYNPAFYIRGRRRFAARAGQTGLLGTTNAIIRKDLWEQHPFREDFNQGWGGEDSEWANYYIQRGYKIIHEPYLAVYHSHHLRWKDILWQWRNWRKMGKDGGLPEKQRRYF